MVHQIVTQQPTGICQTRGVLARRRIQQNARGLKSLRAQDHNLATNLFRFLSDTMNESDATRLIAARVHIDMADDSICHQRAVPGLQRIFHCGERAAEIRKCETTAFAGTAVMTSRPAIVGLSQDCGPANRESSSELILDTLP